MARSKSEHNGELDKALSTLVTAQALLVHTQAEFVAQARTIDREMAELRRESARLQQLNDERFARIERILLDHSRILTDHTRILEALPDAIRQKIGFRPTDQ